MVKKLPLAGRYAILGLVVAVLGIVTPIVWDLSKGKSKLLELKQLEEVVIIQKQDDIQKLKIFYDTEELANLTRLKFILSNTGTTPLVAADLIKPPSISFEGATKILDAK